MNRVDVYTYTDIKGMKKQDGNAWYILETETSLGPANVGDTIRLKQSTENQAELTVLLAAVKRIKDVCELHIYTNSTFAAAGWTVGWIDAWKRNDWKTRKGGQVAFHEIWQKLDDIISSHLTTFHVNEHHAYEAWFKFEANRRKEREYVR